MPRGDQLSRQWRLIQLIDRAQGITVDDAAHALACTVRTIWRDLRVLENAGLRGPRGVEAWRAGPSCRSLRRSPKTPGVCSSEVTHRR